MHVLQPRADAELPVSPDASGRFILAFLCSFCRVLTAAYAALVALIRLSCSGLDHLYPLRALPLELLRGILRVYLRASGNKSGGHAASPWLAYCPFGLACN